MDHKTFAKNISTYTILYIEDDKNIRKYISEFILRYCPNLYSCGSSEEGLELYKKHKPDIVLLDINLPGMNGIDFATIIRKDDKHVRIIISTAYTSPDFTLRAVELDLCRYLVKPLTNVELLNAFKKALKKLENSDKIELGDGYVYDKKTYSIIKGQESILLRKKEAEILEFFINNQDKVISYDILEKSIWNDQSMSKDAIRSQIRNIRQKIEIDCIENVVGVGYIFKIKK